MKPLYDEPKEPLPLHVEEAQGVLKKTKQYVCAYCRYVARDYDAAKECCVAPRCNRCGERRDPASSWRICVACQAEQHKERARTRLEAAVEVQDWAGPVYDEEGDEYYETLGDYLDACEDYDWPRDGYLYVCTTRKPALNAEHIIDGLLEDCHEDAEERHLVDTDELREFIAEWNGKQTLELWDPDFKRKVRVPPRPTDAVAPGAEPAEPKE